MNSERILLLADVIEQAAVLPENSLCLKHWFEFETDKPPAFFAMSLVLEKHDCGTVGCVIGFASVLWPDEETSGFRSLGLSMTQENELSMPAGYTEPELQATRFHPRNVARVLRRLVATGRVEWPE